MKSGILSTLTLLCMFQLVYGSHFRGGTISWEPIDDNGSQIEVRYRFAWRANFEPHYECTVEAIKNETLITGEGELEVVKRGGDGHVLLEQTVKEPLDYVCTDRFDEGVDGDFHWVSGVNSFILDVTENMGTEFDIGYFDCCWIGVLNYQLPRTWLMLTSVDLSPRPDNGRLNTSPMTSSLPLIRIQKGCEFMLEIPYYDKDGDIVHCRWANNSRENECADPNCGRPHEMFNIKDRSCMVHINASIESAEVGWYAVAVMMEDFLRPIARKPLSAVPFHLLVRIDNKTSECNDVITIVPENSCIAVTPGEQFDYRATAKTMTPEIPIVNFASTSPRKMEKSNVKSEGDNIYSVNFSWRPPPKLNGKVETLCYSAFDGERFSGNEVCVELAIGGVHPSPQGALSSPSSEGRSVSLTDNVWELVYDQEIMVDTTVEILGQIRDVTSGVILMNISTSLVNRDVAQNILLLTFRSSLLEKLDENRLYEIEIFPGIVQGKLHCGLPSSGASWTFNTCVPPIPDSGNSVPSGEPGRFLSVLDYRWNITFYQPISLSPDISLLAQILNTTGDVIFNITLDDVILTSPLNETYFLSFWTPKWLYLEADTEYEIRVPAGIAVSNKMCNISSEENSWRFNTTSAFVGGRRPLSEIRDPLVSVLCFPTFFEVFVERNQFDPDTDPAMITLNEPFCYGTEHNDTHYRIGATYGQCGTTSVMNDDKTRVSMTNVVKIPSGAYPVGFQNSKPHPNVEVYINCSLASRRVSFVELTQDISTVVFHSDVIGDFNFSLKMFPNEEYSGRYRVQDFPIVIDENQRLYFEARSFSPKRYGPYLQSCAAAPTSLPHDEHRFTFIENGCPLSSSIEFHESPYSTRKRFSVLAQDLLTHGLNSYLFVHCDIRLCHRRRDECNTNCPTDTNEIPNEIGPISKRSVRSLAVSDEFMDTDGPIIIKRHDNAQYKDTTIPVQWVQITLTCFTAFLCIVCLAMLIIVMKLKAGLQTRSRAKENVKVPFSVTIPSVLPNTCT